MAGLEDGIKRITGNASPILQTTAATSRSSRMRGGEDCLLSGGDCSRRKWTRSQSPLRQLLSTASRSRSTSPANRRRGGGGAGGGGGSGEDFCVGTNDVEGHESGGIAGDGCTSKMASTESVCKMGKQDGRGVAAATESDRTMLPDSLGHTPPQQQQQQHRVCLKNVHHPVSYDECHTPSEEDQAGGDSSRATDCDDGRRDARFSSPRIVSASTAAAGSAGSSIPISNVVDASVGGSGGGSGIDDSVG